MSKHKDNEENSSMPFYKSCYTKLITIIYMLVDNNLFYITNFINIIYIIKTEDTNF